ncbi:hydroxyisocaproate dehydrogenase [Trichophyton violaceum]|uniref:Hydroxyisocaproate dehydrogenase n=1 Tax=Trichophyton violaceum TaxID=34388 RepID=A0A178FH36_TRIVO|nr:hydroxyisocaproate dehydrogenase [Trichophyton violaceum]
MPPGRSVLLIGDITHCKKEWQDFSQLATLKEFPTGSRQEFLANCKSGRYDDVIAIYRSNVSTAITGPFDAELVKALPNSLAYICHNGAGYDNIDTTACSERGIRVSSTPIAVNNATADITMFLMLGALRQAYVPISAIRAGQWQGRTKLGHDPQMKVLGILGMGGIGREVSRRAKVFGMRVIYHNRNRLSPALEEGACYVSFDQLLAQSDVLSLNLSLNATTRHIISHREFAKMKDGAVIVNTARGALIDEKALVSALKSGKVSSAGLDVYENEPCIEPELLDNPKVMLLPHIGTATYETQKEMELLVLENLRSCLQSGKLITPIPEQRDAWKSQAGTGISNCNGNNNGTNGRPNNGRNGHNGHVFHGHI